MLILYTFLLTEEKYIQGYLPKNKLLVYPLSDHYPIIMSVRTQGKSVKNNINTKLDYQKLVKLGATINWDYVSETPDPNVAIGKLVSLLSNLTEETKKRANKKLKPRSNLITPELITSCYHKQKLYKAWKIDIYC